MPEQIIHFAHANSFPAKAYSKLFSYLSDDFEIRFLERHGHDPKFPVTDCWKFLARELQSAIEHNYAGPVIGVGHSLGGILHFLVACENPGLYKAIVLLDAPLVSRLSGRGLQLLKRVRLLERYLPSRAARFRRNFWRTRDEALEYFRAKTLFKNFDPDILRDYCHHCTIPVDSGFRLLFEPGIEAEIYRTIPHTFTKFRGKLRVPAIYIGGTHSREARLARLSFMRKNFPIEFRFIEGSHLFPFEKPIETANLIKNVIKNLSK